MTPIAPPWLSDGAKEHWSRVAPQVIANRTLDENHHYAFALMCESLADMVYLQKVIREEGLTIPGAEGNRKAHPALPCEKGPKMHYLNEVSSAMG